MHTFGEGELAWDAGNCELCYQCRDVCPLDAIAFEEDKLVWDGDVCWRCGRCERVCQSGAVEMPGDTERFMRGLAEAAQAVLSTFEREKVIFVNFLTEIQPECDCMPAADVPVMQDLGILVSDNVVAIEQASIDMLLKSSPLPASLAQDRKIPVGEDILQKLHNRPYNLQIEEAVKLGLGSREYELVTF
jgi:uncharacterized Fe-S center protein